MATNKELSDQILTVATKLGKTVDLNGLNNEKLSSLLDSLKAEDAPAPSAPPAPKPEEDVTAQAVAAAEKRAQEAAEANRLREEAVELAKSGNAEFVVAKGLSITTLRGVVDAGEPIRAADFHGKERDLAELVGRGAIVKAK